MCETGDFYQPSFPGIEAGNIDLPTERPVEPPLLRYMGEVQLTFEGLPLDEAEAEAFCMENTSKYGLQASRDEYQAVSDSIDTSKRMMSSFDNEAFLEFHNMAESKLDECEAALNPHNMEYLEKEEAKEWALRQERWQIVTGAFRMAVHHMPYFSPMRAKQLYKMAFRQEKDQVSRWIKANYIEALPHLFIADRRRGTHAAAALIHLDDDYSRRVATHTLKEIGQMGDLPDKVRGLLDWVAAEVR